jgi:hypothetical protein
LKQPAHKPRYARVWVWHDQQTNNTSLNQNISSDVAAVLGRIMAINEQYFIASKLYD